MGTPTDETWQGICDLPDFKTTFPQWRVDNPFESLKKMCTNMDEQAVDLLYKMVQLEPSERISAKEALKHPYFKDLNTLAAPSLS